MWRERRRMRRKRWRNRRNQKRKWRSTKSESKEDGAFGRMSLQLREGVEGRGGDGKRRDEWVGGRGEGMRRAGGGGSHHYPHHLPLHPRSIATRHLYTVFPLSAVHPRPPRRASHPTRAPRASHSSTHPLPVHAHRQRDHHHHHLPFACAL